LFIIGMPRSGTSWLGKIFDRHSQVLYRHEPESAARVGAPPLICGVDEIPRYLSSTRDYLDRLEQVRTVKSVGTLPYFRKAYRSHLSDDMRLALILGLKGAGRINLWSSLRRSATIPDLIDRGRPEALVIKSIEAVGRINLYRAARPESRTLLIIRHPCGQIASLLEGIDREKFAGRTPRFEDDGLLRALAETVQAKRRGLSYDRLAAMAPIERLAWMWALPNEKAMEDILDDPNVRMLRYDDLCASPTNMARDLFRFAGLSWDPRVDDFIRDSTDPHHAANGRYYSVFRDPGQSVNRWRSLLTAEQVDAIRHAVADTLPGRLFEDW